MSLDFFIYVVIPVLCFVVIIAAAWRIRKHWKQKQTQRVEYAVQPLPKKVTVYEVEVLYNDLQRERFTVVSDVNETDNYFNVRLLCGESHWFQKRHIREVRQRVQGTIYE